jgi:hypothetical protein
MTRFKELRRIESAIEHENASELQWARDYCKSRLQFAKLKDHQKHWRNLIRRIDAVQGDE